MKPLHTLAIVILLGLTACAAVDPKPSNATAASTLKKESTVPLPAHTPFDDDPEARAAYLESFEHGYRIGLAGYHASHDMTYTKHLQAHSEGYFAGQSAGAAVYEAQKEEEPNQQPQQQRP